MLKMPLGIMRRVNAVCTGSPKSVGRRILSTSHTPHLCSDIHKHYQHTNPAPICMVSHSANASAVQSECKAGSKQASAKCSLARGYAHALQQLKLGAAVNPRSRRFLNICNSCCLLATCCWLSGYAIIANAFALFRAVAR